jgi:hypothetical protein
MRSLLAIVLLFLAALPLSAGEKQKANTLTPKEVADGWILLFDGETTFGWNFKGNAKVDNGELVLFGTDKVSTLAKTTSEFGNCEFQYEYRYHAGSRSYSVAKFAGSGHQFRKPKTELTTWVRVAGKVGSNVEHKFMVMVPDTHWEGPYLGPRTGQRSPLEIEVAFQSKVSLRNLKIRPLGLKSIFNGKDLTGWKEYPGKKSAFTVTDKGELNAKNGPGDLQTEDQWKDFLLQLDVFSNGKHLNSGVFFRCIPGQYQQGYEAQIRNQWQGDDRTKPVDYATGGIQYRQAARKVVSNDLEWFTMTLLAQGKHLAVWINGYQTADFIDNRPLSDNARKGCKQGAGSISLQGHDSTTDLTFRNIRIAEIPGDKD